MNIEVIIFKVSILVFYDHQLLHHHIVKKKYWIVARKFYFTYIVPSCSYLQHDLVQTYLVNTDDFKCNKHTIE